MSGQPSVALCIFGQLRDDHIHFPALSKLAADLGAEVFISTWRRRGTKTSGVINIHQIIRMFGFEVGCAIPSPMVGDSRFNDALPAFEATLQETFSSNTVSAEQIEAHFPGAVIDIEDEVMSLDFPQPVPKDSNSLRMLYKIWRCNELKRAAERKRGRPFDIVVQFRPDVLPKIDLQALVALRAPDALPVALYCGGKPGATYLNDIITVSTSQVADQLVGLFGLALQHPVRRWTDIHTEIPRHLRALEITAGNVEVASHVKEDFTTSQPRNRRHLFDMLAQGRVNHAHFPRSTTWPAVRRLLAAAEDVQNERNRYTVENSIASIPLDQEDADFLARAAFVLTRTADQSKTDTHAMAARSIAVFCRVEAVGEAALRNQDTQDELCGIHALAPRLGISEPGTWRSIDRLLAPAYGVPALRHLLAAAHTLLPLHRMVHGDRAVAVALPELFAAAPALAEGLGQVQDLIAGGAVQEAQVGLLKLAAANPEKCLPQAWLGDLLLTLGNLEGALAAFRKAAAMADARADMHAMCSLACQMLGDGAGAIEATREAVQAAPENVLFRTRLASLLSEAGRHGEAEPSWQVAAARLPTDPWVLHALGQCLLALGRTADSTVALSAAAAVAPDEAQFGFFGNPPISSGVRS